MEAVLVGEPDSPVPTRSWRTWRHREVTRPVTNTGHLLQSPSPGPPCQVPVCREHGGRTPQCARAPRLRLAKRGLVLFLANRLVFVLVPLLSS